MKIAKKVFVNQLNRPEASGTNEERKHKEKEIHRLWPHWPRHQRGKVSSKKRNMLISMGSRAVEWFRFVRQQNSNYESSAERNPSDVPLQRPHFLLRDRHRRCCSKCPVSDQPSIPFLYWRLESTPRRDSVTIGSDLKPKIWFVRTTSKAKQKKTLHANDPILHQKAR